MPPIFFLLSLSQNSIINLPKGKCKHSRVFYSCTIPPAVGEHGVYHEDGIVLD